MEEEAKRLREQVAGEALADTIRGAESRWARAYRSFVDPLLLQGRRLREQGEAREGEGGDDV